MLMREQLTKRGELIQQGAQGVAAVCSAGEIAGGGHAVRYGNTGDASILRGYGAVFRILDNEAFGGLEPHACAGGIEKRRIGLDRVAIGPGEDAIEA